MPYGYEQIRDEFVKKGYGLKAAKGHAARIWNASKAGKKNPVYAGYKERKEK